LWSHVDTWCNFLQIAMGALALAGVLNAGLVAYAEGGLAMISAVQLTLSPCRRAIDFRATRARFHELLARAPTMQVSEIDAELEILTGSAPLGVRTYARPAYNIVAESIGKPEARYKLTVFERFMLFLA
jgi:hypothetical protein